MLTIKLNDKIYKYYNSHETLDLIIRSGKSFIRFGDGEYFRIYKPNKVCAAFEENNIEFNKRFVKMYKDLLVSDKILLCLLFKHKHICQYATKDIDPERVYGHAYVSRGLNHPVLQQTFRNHIATKSLLIVCSYIDDTQLIDFSYIKTINKNTVCEVMKNFNFSNIYNDKMTEHEDTIKLFSLLKYHPQVYPIIQKYVCRTKKQKLCVSSLISLKKLSNITTFFRDYDYKIIRAPFWNMYNTYDKYITEIRKESKDKIVLFFIGPVGKLMNYELDKEGYTCWDMGHFLST